MRANKREITDDFRQDIGRVHYVAFLICLIRHIEVSSPFQAAVGGDIWRDCGRQQDWDQGSLLHEEDGEDDSHIRYHIVRTNLYVIKKADLGFSPRNSDSLRGL